MNINLNRVVVSLLAVAFTTIVAAQSINPESRPQLPIDVRVARGLQGVVQPQQIRAAFAARNAGSSFGGGGGDGLNITTQTFNGFYVSPTLPFWTFNVLGSRDGDHHPGVMVGTSPFKNPATTSVPTYIVPLIFRTHSVATAIDGNPADATFGQYTVAPGVTMIDPTKPDAHKCLSAPNNVPIKVVQQSPIVNPAKFVFGGTNVGTTQYVDAFQRANFWNVLGNAGQQNYHVLLGPVITLPPVVIDVPATAGMAITDPNFYEAAFGFSFCAPIQFVDINWFDSYLTGTVIPALAEQGVGPTNFPVFLSYNAAWPVGDVTSIFNCCAAGYHSDTGVPILNQTYGVVDFDTTGWFEGPTNGLLTSIMSHEVAEWMNDPFGANETAPWGGSGQDVGTCQANLEVGDPLTGNDVAPVKMPNGFTYSLQELAFFSWFFGAPSVGVNGWFSDNDTFTTDAGPNCPTS